MIQRKTLLLGIKDEVDGIEYYGTLAKLADNDEDRRLYLHIQSQEREHKLILEHKLKTRVEKKGQTNIEDLLSLK